MPNHERLNNRETEDELISLKNNSNFLGSKVLSSVNYEKQHKAVESSFNKARKNKEKLPGKNSERRNYAYLSRLERLIDKHGNHVEKKLWQNSIKDELLIKFGDIPESYWDMKRQEHRDNGYGNIELTDRLKHKYYEKERDLQKQSLEAWVNYLSDEHSPYPLWFKVYAWDGMTKMGVYSKSKGRYESRNKSTVAPYPEPDAEILSNIFEIVNHYHGNNEKEFYTEDGERNIDLERIVQSGNFNKIYNAVQHEIAPIIEPPEDPEDVHGQWIEYKPGEEDAIALAARGTGWCIASSSVGKHYLKYGTYGQDDWDDDEYDDEYDDETNNQDEPNLKSRFIILHLEDSNTGKLSRNGVASIRLDANGLVAEISGLKPGQALDDSLTSIVEEKVKTLPGGKEFLPKFADRNELIRLDKKMKNNEDLTKEELEFIYEINRPINTLDTYNNYDPRVYEMRDKYGIDYALDAGIDINQMLQILDSDDIAQNLDTLISHGAEIDVNELVSEMNYYDIAQNLDSLISHGADINHIVSEMDPYFIVHNLDTLISHGADINQIVSELTPSWIDRYRDKLLKYGANI